MYVRNPYQPDNLPVVHVASAHTDSWNQMLQALQMQGGGGRIVVGFTPKLPQLACT